MHESSLARGVLEAVLKALPAEPVRVVSVHGKLAETEALSADSIAFHFGVLAKGTSAETARLDLELEHIRAKCHGCGAVYLPEHHLTLCPDCGGTEADLLGEPGLRVDRVEVEPIA